MGKYLLCPMTEGIGLGPVSQLLAIAEELTIRGHDCAFVANTGQARLLAGRGFRSFGAPDPDRGDPAVIEFRMCDTARKLGIADTAYFGKALAAEQAAVDAFRPDAMVSALKLTTPLTARSRDVPLVSVASSEATSGFASPLYPDVSGETMPADLRDVLILNGFDDVQDVAELCYARSEQWVAPCSREFDPSLPAERLSYVGPLLSAGFDLYAPAPNLPHAAPYLVLACMDHGSQPVDQFLDVIARAARQHPSYHFLVVGEEAHKRRKRKPADNMTVTGPAPILRLLQRSALFISGGGYNAIMAALLTGTPIVGLPGTAADRDFNVRRVAALGAGVLVPGYPAPAEQTVHAIERVLRDATFAGNAQAAGTRLRSLPGPAGVVDVLRAL